MAGDNITVVVYAGSNHTYITQIDHRQMIFSDRDGNGTLDSVFSAQTGLETTFDDVATDLFQKYRATAQQLVDRFRATLPEQLHAVAKVKTLRPHVASSTLCGAVTLKHPRQGAGQQIAVGSMQVTYADQNRTADALYFLTAEKVEVWISAATYVEQRESDRPGNDGCYMVDRTRRGVEQYLKLFDR